MQDSPCVNHPFLALLMTTLLPAYDANWPAGASGTQDILPEYDSPNAPNYIPPSSLNHNLPPTFRIDQSYTEPLVQPSDLQAHLVLLGAFHRLREHVRTQKGQSDFRLQPDEMWSVFLERAVHRFCLWVTRMIGYEVEHSPASESRPSRRLTENECPPLDVVMVWHTYMLSPRTYREDCMRMHPGLHAIGSFPLLQLCSTIDAETLLPHTPSESRSTAFGSSTGESFDPPTQTTLEDKVTIFCPNCSKGLSIPWLSHNGNGYAQRGFSALCDLEGGCKMEFDRETLGVRKFYDDMVKCLSSPDKYFLADTLVDFKSGVPRPDLAKVLTEIVLKPKANGLRRPDGSCVRPEALGADLGWKIKDIERLCRKSFLARHNRPVVETPRPIKLIVSAYRQSEPFSMDLSSAVLRQMSFIDKMVTLGWTEHGRFEEDVDTLTRCVVRYHAFLDLMASSTGKFVVPTLDIDLAWHTHQLLCDSYRKLFNIMGMVPDHDDKVTQGALSISYDQTAEAWQARFSVPYSVCGCPPPIKSNSANPITSLLSRKGKGKGAPGPVEIINHRPDLVSVKVVNADETHPSDHNSVALINPREENAAQAQLRRHELKRRCRDIGLASDRNTAKEGGWSGMISKRSIEHSPAFLAPVAYGTKEPFGNYGRGDCAVYSGAGIEGVSAAGECARGNGHESICGALFDHQRNGLAESILQGITMTGDKALMAEYGVKYHSSARAACGSGGHGGGSVAGNFTGFNG